MVTIWEPSTKGAPTPAAASASPLASITTSPEDGPLAGLALAVHATDGVAFHDRR